MTRSTGRTPSLALCLTALSGSLLSGSLLLGGLLPSSALAQAPRASVDPAPGMLRWPDVGSTHICFVYANDIWLVPKQGGMAVPVASPAGQESFPRFSPDGRTIAFVGNYEGGRDIYTIPADGGLATRVTHHPSAETLCDWSPQGGLIYLSNGFGGLSRQSQLMWSPASGGLPTKLPVPYAGFGSISPDGSLLAYTLHSTDNRTWKRYRGGMATDLWLFNLRDSSATMITNWEGTDTLPMWVPGGDGSVLYYLSDSGPEYRLNIWKHTIASGEKTQITKHTEFDVRWPSIGPGTNGKGEIVFQLGSEMRLLDLATGKDAPVKVAIPGDRPMIRAKRVDASQNRGGASLSPSAKRVVIEGRGDLYSVPAKEGITRNLTDTDGIFERDPSWSPDGRWIAYFSDESGDYELWIRPSDAKPESEKESEKDKKAESEKAESKEEGNAESNSDDTAKDQDKEKSIPADTALNKPRKLTSFGPGFRYNPVWSPDSKHIVITDKAGAVILVHVESGEAKTIDTDPWSNAPSVSWSSDSNWIAYAKGDENFTNTGIWLYNVKDQKATRVVSPMFSSNDPCFDPQGDWLYFRSNRSIASPLYSDLDGTYVYTGTEVLLAVPLRADVKNPWAPKSDEEYFKEEKPDAKSDSDSKADKAKGGDKAEGKSDDKADDKSKETQTEQAVTDDGISGTWKGTATGGAGQLPPGGLPFSIIVKLAPDGSISGTAISVFGQMSISGAEYDKSTNTFSFAMQVQGTQVNVRGTVKGNELDATWTAGDVTGKATATRTPPSAAGDKKSDGDETSDKKDTKKPAKEVKIDLAGFESRAIQLPLTPGSFGRLAVSNDNKLIFVRRGARGQGDANSIKIYDITDETKEEKTVTAGGGFDITSDGKKLLVLGGLSIVDAAAGGGKAQSVSTSGMVTNVDPRAEWRQIFQDAWRLQRDFFYEPTLHGVNWNDLRERYGAMIEDCATREDVAWVLAELISELNIGHAYVTSPGDVESGTRPLPVGMLGVDFELGVVDGQSGYRFKTIYQGAEWDADARNPLLAPGVNAKSGEFLLAVNGVPIDTSKDPWSSFIGTAGKVTSLTIGPKPTMDGSQREVLVTPLEGESNLRFRHWIEANRQYIHEKSGGKIGYVYVPNTGVDGQNELYRQFFGQIDRQALIIDDRWNGGGQIPNRFIELLNRPLLNYWARRDGNDWTWPQDAHHGPKAMLINGLAGSGGDMFPALFRQVGLGKLIGTRTWGGLVGITGDPNLIDGGGISVPRFAYYEKDGTWGIEGHGVDPDIEVIDDPSLLAKGIDPQMDKAIEVLLAQIAENPRPAPKRPASPDRSGMGIKPEDK